MSLITVTGLPRVVEAPRGALWAASAAAAAWLAMSRWLARHPPQAMRAAEEASVVRQMARQLEHADPGFAADLYAAADRHEAALPALR